jgi:hypothetical protein
MKIVLAMAGVLLLVWFAAPKNTASPKLAERPAGHGLTEKEMAALAEQKNKAEKCSVADFKVEGFRATIFDDCRTRPCPALKLTGKLRNHCAVAASAEIKITALDSGGDVIDTIEAWPASIRNIAPGQAYAFDLGPLMRYRMGMERFEIEVIDVRVWP